MKAIYKNIALAALALSAVACTQEEDFAPSFLNDPDAVRITAQVASDDVTGGFTRSNPLGTTEDEQKAFNSDDAIAVTAGNQAAVTYTFNGTTWTPEEGKYLKWEEDEMNFTAWYPVGEGTDATTFTVPTSYADVNAMADADYMVYSGSQNKTSGNGVTLPMNRKMARIVITPVLNDEFATGYSITGIKVHANTSGYANGEPQTGDIQVSALKQGDAYYALLAPTRVDANVTFLTVTIAKTDGTTPQDLTVKGIPAIEAGQSYDYTLTVGKAEATIGSVTVNSWTDGTINGGKAEEVPEVNYVWTSGIAASASVEGNGTEESPYLIHSANDLQWMIDQVNDAAPMLSAIDDDENSTPYYRLTHNLEIDSKEDAPWTPIGTEDSPFVGYFDGGGYTISGEMVTAADVVDAGFFGYVGVGTVITNLTNAANVTSLAHNLEKCYVGGIVGFAIGYDAASSQYNSTYIIACHNTGTITNGTGMTVYSATGGIAGGIFNGTCVLACSNTGNLVGNDPDNNILVGGIVGLGECNYTDPSIVSCWTGKGVIVGRDNGVTLKHNDIELNYSTDSNYSDKSFYISAFTEVEVNGDGGLNDYIYAFNGWNSDYTGRTISCNWHWELTNGSVVLVAGKPT